MLTRRRFLQLCLHTAAAAGLAQLLLPELAQALRLIPGGKPPVLWVEGTSCTGNSISLDNSSDPSLRTVLQEIIDLRFSQLYMWPSDHEAIGILYDTMERHRDEFILVVEGGIPMGLPESVWVGDRNGSPASARDVIPILGNAARAVVAVGNCAAFGGPSMGNPNPTGTKGVWKVVQTKPVINVPGCPAHPDWIVGTLVHLLLYGLPRVDEFRRPTMFFGQLVHDICPRRFHFFNGEFAQAPGQAGCLFKVGCKGPITHADCPTRKFNDGVNWCINANNPCIGCAAPDFPDGGTSPFFSHLTDVRVPPGVSATALTVTKAVGAVTGAAIATHLAVSYATGRLGENLTEETETNSAAPAQSGITITLPQEERDPERLEKRQESLQYGTRRSFLSRLNIFRRLRRKDKL